MKEHNSANLVEFVTDLLEAFKNDEEILNDKTRRFGSRFVWYTAPKEVTKPLSKKVVPDVKVEEKTSEKASESVTEDVTETPKKTTRRKRTTTKKKVDK